MTSFGNAMARRVPVISAPRSSITIAMAGLPETGVSAAGTGMETARGAAIATAFGAAWLATGCGRAAGFGNGRTGRTSGLGVGRGIKDCRKTGRATSTRSGGGLACQAWESANPSPTAAVAPTSPMTAPAIFSQSSALSPMVQWTRRVVNKSTEGLPHREHRKRELLSVVLL